MTFSGINFLGVLIAFIVSFASGGAWFGPKTFYPVWMKARGIDPTRIVNNSKPAVLFGSTAAAVLIQTLVLGVIITSLQKFQPDFGIIDGAGVGFALGVGIAAFASLSHRLFGGDGFKAWIIETTNDAINLTIAGAIIAFLN